jgi:hypothetical protein
MGNPTYTPQQEIRHAGGFMVSQAPGRLSFEQATLTGGAAIKPGTVLGAKTIGASATSAALGTNTGNGVFGAVTLTTLATQIGTYDVTFTAATAFTVTAPDGTTSTGTTGNAFSALGLGFTITAGGTAMVADDGFTITVADGAGKPIASSAAKAGNTGNATMGTITPTGYAAQAGIYRVTFIKANTNLGTFVVEDPAVFKRSIERFLHLWSKSMNFIDKYNSIGLKLCKHPDESFLAGNRWCKQLNIVGAHFMCHSLSQRGLASTRRAEKKRVANWRVRALCRINLDTQIFSHFVLTYNLFERLRTIHCLIYHTCICLAHRL